MPTVERPFPTPLPASTPAAPATEQTTAGCCAGFDGDGTNIRPPIDSLVGIAEGDRCILEKNALLHKEGTPDAMDSKNKSNIPSHQSVLPPKSQAALVPQQLAKQIVIQASLSCRSVCKRKIVLRNDWQGKYTSTKT